MNIETKYGIGDKPWVLDEPHVFGRLEPVERQIREIHLYENGTIMYLMHFLKTGICKNLYPESKLFPTKEDLLNSL